MGSSLSSEEKDCNKKDFKTKTKKYFTGGGCLYTIKEGGGVVNKIDKGVYIVKCVHKKKLYIF